MLLNKVESINIFGINISKLTYDKFLEIIDESIKKNKQLTIGYANADTLNKISDDIKLKNIYDSFDLIHPDGIGVYLASKFLYGKNGFQRRITGSDFYQLLIDESIKNNRRVFFFGHSDKTLNKIKQLNPLLNICGLQEGYNFDSSIVIEKINKSGSDIIIIGLSAPIQENWIYKNKDKINFKVILTVGDGIKVFAGEKIRGPVILRNLGLEWAVRYITNPVVNFKKYIIGIPLFIIRILKQKFRLI